MEDNKLNTIALSSESDEVVINAFVAGKLREVFSFAIICALNSLQDTEKSLRIFLSKVTYPLSVRSSSVFEDVSLTQLVPVLNHYQAMDKPYAGIYETYMLPNNDPDVEVRLTELTKAVKMVYASTYSQSAKAYEQSSGSRPEEAKMAVIIQQLVGHREHDQFYPTFSGVAGSYDVYAKSGTDPNKGYCAVALGLGGTVVNGGYMGRFSPAKPK